jgi:hypothetical protein
MEGSLAYCTFEDVKARLRAEMPRWDTEHVETVIEAVCERIDQETGRTFEVSGSESRVYEAQRDGFVTIEDATSISSISWEGSVVDGDDYRVRRNPYPALSVWALVDGPWYETDEVTVTGTFGYADSVPEEIWDLAVTWTARVLKRADTGVQDVTAIPELGELVYHKAIPANLRRALDRKTRLSAVLRIS